MKRKDSGKTGTSGSERLHLFHGDEFLVKERVEALLKKVLSPELRDTNLVVLDGGNIDISLLTSHIFTPSLFGGLRVVVVEQTPAFIGRSDRGKLLDKAISQWRRNDRKGACRAFGQLLSATGLEKGDLVGGDAWLQELLGGSAASDRVETVRQVAAFFLESDESPAGKGDEASLEDIVSSDLPEDALLIFTADQVDRRKRLFKLVEKRGRVVECSVAQERYGRGMDRSFFEARVNEVLGRWGKKATPRAISTMYKRSGKEMRRLEGELEKLVSFVGDREEISPEDVEAVFTDFHEAAYFELNSALRTRDLSKSLPALHENLNLVDHPLQTLGGIANEFRRLLAARELLFTAFRPYWKRGLTYSQFRSVLKKVLSEHPEWSGKNKPGLLKMKEYAIFQYLSDAQRFPLEKLVAIMEAILEADIMMKSTRIGSVAPQAVMEDLVMKICDRGAGTASPRRPWKG